ncbi:GNAT family N-acetyltransferase [Winogradskyella sp.]|uniref:GNAT family N-acetyltransferase n=1 Tax=Winogradskyella sp. TaxID=1883156 RepID=UPI00262306C9|nr:GNAT family N-acetyltransferase [Winogradskyella sp.]
MDVRHLGNTGFKVIMECFLSAFENYYVQMPTNHDYYKQRWKAAGVQYDLSFGMFDGERLVGFIINAIDKRQGHLTAYNSGTGIIPDYRGQRIVKTIYEYAIPELKRKGIAKCQLEVITENEKAIKSYQGTGFGICKHYKCYKGTISSQGQQDFNLKKVEHQSIDWHIIPDQDLYSWDNQKESLAKGNYEYYQLFVNNTIQSYFVMDSASGYVAQFGVLEDSHKQWETLFMAIKSINQNVRINNIDERLRDKINAVESLGLQNSFNQYEMELFLDSAIV